MNRPHLSRPPHSGMLTLLMAFVVVIVTWAGNVALAYVCVFPYLRYSLISCMHSPIALGVFTASFVVVLASLLVISAQPTILRLVIFFYSASPLSRWAITRGWRRYLVSWYNSRRAARTCIWIKDDDVRFFKCLPLCCSCFYPWSRSTSCYEHCSPCRRTFLALEQLYSSMHMEGSTPYPVNSTQMPVSLTRHSRQSPLSELRSHTCLTPLAGSDTCFSLAFASGNFGPAVSSFPVRKAG